MNQLTLTTENKNGLVSYSLDGEITEVFESCGEFKKDTFAVGEFAFDGAKIEKSAQWYLDNFENVTLKRVFVYA